MTRISNTHSSQDLTDKIKTPNLIDLPHKHHQD